MKRKLRNFEIAETLKRRSFEADAEQGNANRGISVRNPFVVGFGNQRLNI